MNINHVVTRALMGASGLMLLSAVHAGGPVWTLSPVAGYPPTVTVSPSTTATIKYTVLNRSHKPHKLQMKPIQGITPSGCAATLEYQQSCTLTLAVNGGGLNGDVIGGPVLCDQGDSNQCYQPSPGNNLAIRLTSQPPTPPVQQYTVTSSAGANGLISPSGAQTVNPGATLNFTATANAGYGINEWLLDGTPAQTGGTSYQLSNITTNHTVSVTFGAITLTPSVSSLSMSINCLPASACATTQDAALTGNARQITIQNTGSLDATNVLVNSSGFPAGTSITGNTCTSTLSAGSSCVITVTPGNVANTSCTSGTQPTASTITITADGGLSSQVDAYVLGYGCQYQGGFIYAIDDTTPNTGSIGGKVVSLVDQAAPSISSGSQPTSILWSSDGNNATSGGFDVILGIDQTSTTTVPSPTAPAYPVGTPAFVPCNGATDGACITGNIISYYNFNRDQGGAAPTPLTYYAAGLCKATINGYSDWYLPASCELDAVNGGFLTCPGGTQSMLASLSFLIGNSAAPTPSISCSPPAGTNCLAGEYWAATEDSTDALFSVFTEVFNSGGSRFGNTKNALLGVRCSRAITS